MRARLTQHAGAAATRALLSPFGIGVSKHVGFLRSCATTHQSSSSSSGDEIVALTATRSIAAGAPLAILPDTAMLTCQAALDADVDGLVPPPAEMLEMLKGDTVRLDEVYLAYYLALRYFTKPKDWFAAQLDLFRGNAALSSSSFTASDSAAAVALWQRASREYVSAPQPLFMAALRYVRASSFQKPALPALATEAAQSAASSSPPQPAALAVAPVVDVLVRCNGRVDGGGAALTACTAKDVLEKYLAEDIRGARQALQSKDAASPYWALMARDDIPAGGALTFSSQSQ